MSREKKLWPTPNASEAKHPGRVKLKDGQQEHPANAVRSPCSPVVSHVNLTALRENVEALVMSVTSGQKTGELLGRYDPATTSVRMFQVSLPLMADSSLMELLVTWPKWGTLSDGVLMGRSMSVPLIDEIEFSLWAKPNTLDSMPPKSPEALTKELQTTRPGQSRPANLRDQVSNMKLWRTLDASMTTGGATNGLERLRQGHALGLQDQVATPALWPTPRAGKVSEEDEESWTARQEQGKVSTPPLEVKMWPTPTATDYRCGYGDTEAGRRRLEEKKGRALRDEAGSGGQLNPEWIEWLMGFPLGWTDLKDSETP